MYKEIYGEDLANYINENFDKTEDLEDELPDAVNLRDSLEDLPPLPEALIEGVLRLKHKMIVTGPSKMGKSMLLMGLSMAFATGGEWFGFKCRKSRVLYINLEIDALSSKHRFNAICEKLGVSDEDKENVLVHDWRGYARSLDKLTNKIVHSAQNNDIDVIIIDPFYKVNEKDENSASAMTEMCNCLDMISRRAGAAVIFSHHHSKGPQGGKNSMDRGSGSGVFSRDPDAIIDLTLNNDMSKEDAMKATGNPQAKAYKVSGTLREFQSFDSKIVWFNYPLFVVDKNGTSLESSSKSAEKSQNASGKGVKMSPDARRARFDRIFEANAVDCGDEYRAPKEAIKKALDIKERTIKDYISKYKDTYSTKNDFVVKKKS